MKKTIKLWLALALMVLTGTTQAWAAAPKNSYTITFKSTAFTSASTIENIIDNGAAYVKEFPSGQANYLYTTWNGLQIGDELDNGLLTMQLATTLKPTKITFEAMKHEDVDKANITVNGKKFALNGEAWGEAIKDEKGDFTGDYAPNYEIELDGKTAVSAIQISADARAYIQNIQITYDVTKLYIVKYDRSGTNKYDLANTIEMTWNDEDKVFEYSYISDGKTYFYFTLSDVPTFAYDADDDDSYNNALNAFNNNHRWNYSGNRNLASNYYCNLYKNKDYSSRYFYMNSKGSYKIKVNQEVNRIDYTYDNPLLTVYPASGTDIAEEVEKAIEAKKEANKDFVVTDIEINLNYNGKYTISKTIEAPAKFTLYGNNATIDASELEAPFVTLSATPGVAANEWGAYPVDQVYFNQVTINELKQELVRSLGNYLVKNLQVSNSVINLSKDKIQKMSIFNFGGGAYGNVAQLRITNSTLYAPDGAKWQNGGLFSSQSSKDIRELDKSTNDDGDLTATQMFYISQSTLYNIAYKSTVNTLRKNTQDYIYFNIQNNIIANCGKKNDEGSEFLRGLNAGQEGKRFEDKNENKIQNWRVANNTFMFDGAIVVEKTVGTNNVDDKDTENAQNVWGTYETAVEFADAANGDLTLKGESVQKFLFKGDYRWCANEVNTDKAYEVVAGDIDNTKGSFGGYDSQYIKDGGMIWGTYEGSTINAYFNINDYNYAITSVTAVPYYNPSDAKAPKRAPGFMQSIKATKITDTQWAFIMPRANVKLDATFAKRIDMVGDVTIGEVEPVTADFKGEVKPEIVITDRLEQVEDEDGNKPGAPNYVTTYKTLKEGTDYTVEFKDNTKAGEAQAIITGIGDYTATATYFFDIPLAVATSDEVKGELVVVITDDVKKLCTVTEINPAKGETEFTIPAKVDGYTITRIAAEALENIDDAADLKDFYLPEISDEGLNIAKTALLPVGFTHPQKMFNVHVPLANLDEYASMDALKKFAQYKRLVAEIEIGESNFATFGSRTPALFEEAVEVNIIKSYTATTVTKEVVEGNLVPANTGVLLFAKPGTYTVYAVDDNYPIGTISGNKLVAVDEAQNYPLDDDDAAANAYFILKEGAFYPIADNKKEVPACRAILKVAKGDAAAAASRLDIVIDGFTGINAVKADLNNAQIYDMQGRKVNNAQKGVYIVNGKKVVIK